MTKRKTTTYWLLLTGILLLVTAAILVRPARSHYINTTVWNTALYPEESVPTSNCLVAGGQTILLGKLDLTNEQGEVITSSYPFTLSAPNGMLDWRVSYSDSSQVSYLTANVTAVENEKGTMDAALELTPDLTVAHPEVTADITVTWTVGLDTLSGTFHVTIPEVVKVPDETTDDTLDDTSGGTTEDGTEGTDSGTGTDTEEAEQTQETPAVAATAGTVVLTVTAPETYDSTGLLPVHIAVEGTFNALYLGMPRTDESGAVTMGELPSFTRYSLDGGNSWTLLYEGGLVELTEGGAVLLDLSQTALDLKTAQTFYVQIYNEENLVQEQQFTAVTATLLPQEYTVTPRVVTASEGFSIALPGQWSGGELTWTVSVRNADGTYSIIEDLAAAGLTVEKTTNESGDTLNIQLTPQSEIRPAPGTYKLQLQWSWQGADFAGTQLTFFVNYVVDTQA